jgi:glycosidase
MRTNLIPTSMPDAKTLYTNTLARFIYRGSETPVGDYYGQELKGANLPFNFLLLQSAWNAQAVAEVISEYMKMLPVGAWPNWVLGNHDNARIATRVGVLQAPIAAMLLLTLPGRLTIYYGEELGMTNVLIPPEDVQDPAEKNQPGIGMGRARTHSYDMGFFKHGWFHARSALAAS